MANWITISKQIDFPINSYRIFDWNNVSILVINAQGDFYAIENRCPHENQTMEGGELEGDEFICPWHGAGFCIKSGAVTRPPAYEGIKTFPVREKRGIIQIDVNSI